MAQSSRVWDGVLIGDATDAPYSALEWARIWKLMFGNGTPFPNYGVFSGSGDGTYNPLQVNATAVISANVQVQIGAALVNGRFYENTAVETLAVGANSSGNPRIDTVILRADYVGQTVRLAIKQGTPAGSPARPTLQQDTIYWEMPLADIAVANGFATLAQTTITQRQRALHALADKWQPTAYPLCHVHNGNFELTSVTFASTTDGKAIPFVLDSNMLLQDVLIRHVTTVVNYTINWGLYIQDVNDGNTAEKTLRLVANGGTSGATAGTETITAPATPTPQVLTPGTYWLVLSESAFTGAGLAIGAISIGVWGLGVDTPSLHLGTVASIAQTIDLVTGWSVHSFTLAVCLRGRIFGKTTVP